MIYNCLICGAERPTAYWQVWKRGMAFGLVCSSHTLREVAMSRYKAHEFDLSIEVVEDPGALAAELENAWHEGFEAGREAANSDKG